MTDEMDHKGPDGPGGADLAGEYALGLLEGAERAEFEARLAADPELRGEVARWQEHFAALGMDIEEVTPPKSVLRHLQRELWGENKLPWRRRIRIWEFALGGVAAALLAWVVYGTELMTPQPDPMLRAQIGAEDAAVRVALAFSEQTGILQIERTGAAPQEGRVFELWAIAGEAAPVSLGVLPEAAIGALALRPEQARLVSAGTVLAISDEPLGGSPTGAPTGAVLGAGEVMPLTNL